MNFKVGIGIIIAVVIGALLLSGLLGKLIGLAISLAIWGFVGYLAGNLVQGEGYGLLAISCWASWAGSSVRCWSRSSALPA